MGEHYVRIGASAVDRGGEDEAPADVPVGPGLADWARGDTPKATFVEKILRLVKIAGVLKFPVSPMKNVSAPARNAGLDTVRVISCHESVCARCSRDYVVKDKLDAIALRQVGWQSRMLLCRCTFLFRGSSLKEVYTTRMDNGRFWFKEPGYE